LTNVNPENAHGRPDAGRDGGKERRTQPAPGDRPAADRSFASAPSDGAFTAPKAPAMGLEIQHEAVQAGQDILRAGQRTALQTSQLWRESLEPFAALQTEMNRWFDAWRNAAGLGAMQPLRTARPFAQNAAVALMGAPAADLKETGEGYRLCIEVPGMEADDLKLGVRNDMLVIHGQKTEENHQGGDIYQISERRFGSFERAIPLPADVDRDAIAAKLESGVLKVNLPKTAEAAGAWSRIHVQT